MFDVSNINIWKLKMSSMYLKILGMNVYLATTKKPSLGNDKHIEANAQVRTFIYYFSLWFRFCNVEHFDLSRTTNNKICGEGI